MSSGPASVTPLADPAYLAAALLAISPAKLRGANLRISAGPARDRWIDRYCALARQSAPIRLPPSVSDDALDGGLDLGATLAVGRPIYRKGVIHDAAGGTVLLAMAERWSRHTAARLATAMDRPDDASAFAVIGLDEGIDGDERPPDSILDRVAFHLFEVPEPFAGPPTSPTADEIEEARARLPTVCAAVEMVELLVCIAARLGITSIRPIQFAVHAANAHASLCGRRVVDERDVTAAATLVLAPRATQHPLPPANENEAPQQDAEEGREPDSDAATSEPLSGASMQDRIVETCVAHLPKGLLESLLGIGSSRPRSERGPKQVAKLTGHHGRTIGVRKGVPRRGERFSLPATLLAAAPWQGMRRRESKSGMVTPPRRLHFRMDDLRRYRHKHTQRVTTVFSVDASGSSAVHRLAEAKGAVEQLLAQSYVRRDRVALVAFRARRAEVLLHPTRSLARARRTLAELPGGGATPLASGIREAHTLAAAVLRSGQQCHVVLLTDGCANVDTEGRGGRAAALEEALLMARRLRADRIASLVIDTSPKPSQQSFMLAEALGARYVPLPQGSAENISETVRQFGQAGHREARMQPG